MASAPPLAPPEPMVKEEQSAVDLAQAQSLLDQLYDQCATRPAGTLFFQRDFINMQVADDMGQLLSLIQSLTDKHLMKLMTFDGEACWQIRSRAEADTLRRLTSDERLIYYHIDQAQTEGAWSKALRQKTHLPQQTVTKILKSLESRGLVQSVMSVRNPSRKMYLLKHLRASEEIAGGPWQTDGEFDRALIDIASEVVAKKVQQETCIKVPAPSKSRISPERAARIAQKVAERQAQAKAVRDIEDSTPDNSYHPPLETRLVHRHNPFFPNAAGLTEYLNGTHLLRERTVREQDMEQLLEMMVLEDRIEKVSATSYRTVLLPASKKVYNGFVDAPCGNCPVFEQCQSEGPISARTCVYFGEWLGTESEKISID